MCVVTYLIQHDIGITIEALHTIVILCDLILLNESQIAGSEVVGNIYTIGVFLDQIAIDNERSGNLNEYTFITSFNLGVSNCCITTNADPSNSVTDNCLIDVQKSVLICGDPSVSWVFVANTDRA